MFFKRKNKSVSIDFSNIYLKKIGSKEDIFRVELLGKHKIKKRFLKKIMVLQFAEKTIIIGFKSDFSLFDFSVLTNKILRSLK